MTEERVFIESPDHPCPQCGGPLIIDKVTGEIQTCGDALDVGCEWDPDTQIDDSGVQS